MRALQLIIPVFEAETGKQGGDRLVRGDTALRLRPKQQGDDRQHVPARIERRGNHEAEHLAGGFNLRRGQTRCEAGLSEAHSIMLPSATKLEKTGQEAVRHLLPTSAWHCDLFMRQMVRHVTSDACSRLISVVALPIQTVTMTTGCPFHARFTCMARSECTSATWPTCL